jgi:hypothetical protein
MSALDTRGIATVQNFDVLRAVDTQPFPDRKAFFAMGNVTLADAGVGFFYWNTVSVVADDDADTLKPDDRSGADPGRWVRVELGSGVTPMTLVIETRFTDGDFHPGVAVIAPTGEVDQFYADIWSSGGGGTAATGGGQGGHHSGGLVPYTGVAVPVAGLAPTAINTDGVSATVGGTVVVALGGVNGTKNAAGTLTDNVANGTGTSRHNGGSGGISVGTGARVGGGGAGSAGNAVTPVPAQGGIGGEPDGGFSGTTSARFIGAGGPSSDAAGFAAARGEFRGAYQIPATLLFPRILGQSVGRDTADGLTTTITLPPSIHAERQDGERILLVAFCDGVPTLAMHASWSQVQSKVDHSGSSHCAAAFQFDASAADPTELVITKGASQSLSWHCFRLANAGSGIEFTSLATTTGTNADAPSHTPSQGAGKYLIIAAIGWDGSLITFTAGPAGYSNVVNNADRLALGTTVMTAVKYIDAASENPGAVTSSSAAWIGLTFSVPYAA